MARTISHSFASLTREILFLPLEHKIHIFSPPCNILYLFFLKCWKGDARKIYWSNGHSSFYFLHNATGLGRQMKEDVKPRVTTTSVTMVLSASSFGRFSLTFPRERGSVILFDIIFCLTSPSRSFCQRPENMTVKRCSRQNTQLIALSRLLLINVWPSSSICCQCPVA